MSKNEMDLFIEQVHAIIEKGGTEQEITNQVASRLQGLLDSGYSLPEKYRRPNKEKYVLYPVYVAEDGSFSIASAVWDVGQKTPVHDHQTWGVIGIIQGTEYEESYVKPKDDEEKPLRPLTKTHLNEGEVAVCCTTDQDIHKVSCVSDIPCVGLHVYGGNIGEIKRHVFDVQTGKRKEVVTTWDEITG